MPANEGHATDVSSGEPGDAGSIPWWRQWQPTAVFLPEKFHGERSLVGYSPCYLKESDMTEHACMHSKKKSESSKGNWYQGAMWEL